MNPPGWSLFQPLQSSDCPGLGSLPHLTPPAPSSLSELLPLLIMVDESTWPAHFTVLAAERGHPDATSGPGSGSPDVSCRSWSGTGHLETGPSLSELSGEAGGSDPSRECCSQKKEVPDDEDDRCLLYACPPWGRALCWGPAVERSVKPRDHVRTEAQVA